MQKLNMPRRLRTLSAVLMLAAVLSVSNCSVPSVAEVVLTDQEADSLIAHISAQDSILIELEYNIWAAVDIAVLDSTLQSERLVATTEMYEQLLAESTPGFLERIFRWPVLWLAIGVWVGLSGAR